MEKAVIVCPEEMKTGPEAKLSTNNAAPAGTVAAAG
jgi:hypothetical protein